MDQDMFAGPQPRVVEQPLPCRQCADRNTRRFLMTEYGWLRRDAIRLRQAILRGRALGEPIVESKNLASDPARIASFDDAGKFVPWDRSISCASLPGVSG